MIERKISNKILSIFSPHWEARVRRSLEKLTYLRILFVYSRHSSAFLSVALEAFSHHRGHSCSYYLGILQHQRDSHYHWEDIH